MATEFVLWGAKYSPVSIKIAGGTMRDCKSAMKSRESEGGWSGLEILPKGNGPQIQIVEQDAERFDGLS